MEENRSRVLPLGVAGLLLGALLLVPPAPVASAVPAAPPAPATRTPGTGPRPAVPGIDVSSHQGAVDWGSVAAGGGRFAYVKATEGTGYTNPFFAQQYNGSYGAGLIRGAYHYALPDVSGAVAQADYFVDHGGGWSPDGMTLPPALDIEYNPYGPRCYGLGQADLAAWIQAFSDRVRSRTGRHPMIYTTADWWSQCTGNLVDFSATNPLWVARYAPHVGELPFAWKYHTIWQFANAGAFPGDQDLFNGTYERLRALAYGRSGWGTE